MNFELPIFGKSPAAEAASPSDSIAPPSAPARAHRPNHLIDSHGRIIRDLRLSITDRCNFRCVYCMDPDFRYMPKTQLLTLDEYIQLVKVCLDLGIEKVRITGGEPTLYPHIDELIAALGRLAIHDLAITTNGSLLDKMPLRQWKESGLRRLTFSLDSLRPQRVQAITRTSVTPHTVINAIRLAHDAGFAPIKVNAVIMRGVNDDEVADFADFALEHAIDMRLIEFMPLDSSRAWNRQDVVSADEMLDQIRQRHQLIAVDDDDPSSTSMNFVFANHADGLHRESPRIATRGAQPRIGIIAPVTRPFCGACSRLRITADGKVRPCLFSLSEWDLKPLLRSGASQQDIRDFLVNAVWTKQAGHGIGTRSFIQPQRTMSAIGG